ncbi:oxygen-independent coproporphyrinogen-3 oxidase [Peptoclostridium litorale DSM 5388]|uniref:Heme chaperone HemW n=1 Tax=Peptoclostridium litorale DSM 5388 TaxID=1121324 RepID=A0A069RFT8_PEPLI|nr:radical SAM family heme chaperone HemW [Peptoclostridium litorale]KDR95055.1 oxygen-independent coproporphyrinogen-III oxidase 1 [Peptoclostridium litorale DSM 5388]SIN75747.1 oxygen-independent coproporphyrinogen-3 oxidase [Peptoclostridium litorale DSM 5388]
MDAGLYVHIPFCVKKCSYCDFNSFPIGKHCEKTGQYVDYLVREMEIQSKAASQYEFSSVFVGGGTPTILCEEGIELLFEGIYKNFNIAKGAEITMEANPKTLSEGKLKVIKKCGVNRLSMGLQAAQENILQILGRIHSYEDFVENYDQARMAGFENINVDLMFSIPGQTFEDWMDTLEKVTSLSPEHISAYSLIVEEGTPICESIERGGLVELDEDTDRKMYHEGIKFLKDRGYVQYEISNFSKPGHESAHNIKYWRCSDYVGLGPGAHSYMNGVRHSNCSSLEEYYASIDEKRPPVNWSEAISQKQQMEETMFMGLRMNEGVSKGEFYKKFNVEFDEVYGDKVDVLEEKGLLEIKEYRGDKRVCLTLHGIDISNTVFIEFLID